MNTRYEIKSSPAQSFQHVFRCGFGWPATGIEVECDPAAKADDIESRVITLATLASLKADPRISVTIAGAEDEMALLRKRVAELEAQLAAKKPTAAKATPVEDKVMEEKPADEEPTQPEPPTGRKSSRFAK